MLAGHKFGACLPTFGSCADRYCLGGYGPPKTVDQMLAEIRALPLESQAAFLADRRNIHTAESCLRRALEEFFAQ